MVRDLGRLLSNDQQERSLISVKRQLDHTNSQLQRDLQSIASSVTDKYLQHKLLNLESTLLRDRYITEITLSRIAKPLQDIVLIDYGGGPGLHSLLAKELGIGTVIYNDILHHYCTLAEEMAKTLGRKADYYVEGNIDVLVKFCVQNSIKADVITSSDVLEHIYDIDDFLRKLHLLSHDGTVTMHLSGANMFWYPWVVSVSKLHEKVEKDSGEEVDLQSSCYDERMKIIREYENNLKEDELRQLATITRGLAKSEIINALQRYLKSGERPMLIEHATNTCNPQTGYWAERSMNPYYLRETLSSNGFYVRVLAGPWEKSDRIIVKMIRALLNFLIRISPTYAALHLTYYYSIYGEYTGKFDHEIHKEHIYRHAKLPLVYVIAAGYKVVSIFRGQRDWWKL